MKVSVGKCTDSFKKDLLLSSKAFLARILDSEKAEIFGSSEFDSIILVEELGEIIFSGSVLTATSIVFVTGISAVLTGSVALVLSAIE
ncbi:hypothetical protein AB3G33_12625 [Flavobacterium sp. WC2421]|uniref:hypothetical protein n=1 Tax=Flavobacterium sp. WC2421 TaxID=3234138 RepID=UPI003467951A